MILKHTDYPKLINTYKKEMKGALVSLKKYKFQHITPKYIKLTFVIQKIED